MHSFNTPPSLRRPFVRCFCALAMVLSCLFTLALHAQVPQLLSYQGRVAAGGVNFDGAGQFAFALVNTNGSTTYWSNDGTSTAGSQPAAAVPLTVTKGLYSVLLGDTTLANMIAIPATVWTNADVRLRVWFNDGTNGFQLLTPDQRLAPNGYLPDGAVTSAKIAAGAVTSTQLATGAVGAGNIGTGAVGTAQLATAAVGSGQLAPFAVQSYHLVANAVRSFHITAGAVGNVQMGLCTITGLVTCNKTDPTHTYVYARGTSSVAFVGDTVGNNCYPYQLTLMQPGTYTLVAHASNGSEVAYSGTVAAGQTLTNANLSPVDLTSDVNNCGSCSNVCSLANATPKCTSGSCQIASCNFGYADCNGVASDGCETSINTDLNNCGRCGNVCPAVGANATPACSNGACAVACNAGFAHCSGDSANGCDTNINTNASNCGSCGHVCSTANCTSNCTSGACVIASCNPGFADCNGNAADGCEVNTSTDRNNCGGCGHICPGIQICSAGACH